MLTIWVEDLAGVQLCDDEARSEAFGVLAARIEKLSEISLSNCHLMGALVTCLFGAKKELRRTGFDWIMQRKHLWGKQNFLLSHWIPQVCWRRF